MAGIRDSFRGMLSEEVLTDLESMSSLVRVDSVSKGVEDVTTPGACDPNVGASKLTTDGTDAVTLGDGSYVGQRKQIVMIIGTTTPIADITPANYADGTTVSLNAVGDSVELEWDGSTWHTVGGSGFVIS